MRWDVLTSAAFWSWAGAIQAFVINGLFSDGRRHRRTLKIGLATEPIWIATPFVVGNGSFGYATLGVGFMLQYVWGLIRQGRTFREFLRHPFKKAGGKMEEDENRNEGKTVAIYASWKCPDPADLELAELMGKLVGAAGYAVVFGGGSKGPMGAAGRAAFLAGAHVTSVTKVDWVETCDAEDYELRTRATLPARMGVIEKTADAGFLILPGGLGSAAELYSVWADAANGDHGKPIIVIDRGDDDFDLHMEWARRRVARGYISEGALDLVTVVNSPEEAMAILDAHVMPATP